MPQQTKNREHEMGISNRWLITVAALLLPLAGTAKLTEQEAARLKPGGDLTPVGAERMGNKDGTIPAWDGGLLKPPPCYKGPGSRYCDPYPDDKPVLTIGKDNMEQHKDKLSPGQMAMMNKYPSFRMKVYPTRRSAGYPDFVYAATYKNALNAELGLAGEALLGAITGFPFPIARNGQEAIWNHKVRYRGLGISRWNNQAAVTESGSYTLVKIREEVKFPYGARDVPPESLKNVIVYFFQVVEDPPRLAGQITLVHETMDQLSEPRRAWQYNPGQRRLRRAPNVGYDNPSAASDGLRTNDQLDSFNGATDRYTWKLVGKKEMYIPYNAYHLHSDEHEYADIVRKGHINMDLPRYELHRVWVVDSVIKPRTSHMYKRRTFYLDEDSWQISVVDIYDNRDQLWRLQEQHAMQAYNTDKPYFSLPAMETAYDLISGRYIAYAMNNEEDEVVEKDIDKAFFDPSNVQKQATK
jgi:hypothetical protein